MWMTLALAGFSIRADLLGVTSFIRACFIKAEKYRRLLFFFHTPALDINTLTKLWVKLALRLFSPVTCQGYTVLIADGLKVPKEGHKMPAVKSLRQESQDNAKPAFIMGHSFQALGLLVAAPLGQFFCVPLISRIHEGLVWSNRDKRTLLDKLVELFFHITGFLEQIAPLVADGYYVTRKILRPLFAEGHHLLARVRTTTVAYHPAPPPKQRRRGRRKVYGKKIYLKNYWKQTRSFVTARSPVYGDEHVKIQYICRDLLWRRVGKPVRFVLVKHPSRGRIVLTTTLTSLDPLEIIRIYGYRFKIEVSFKQALRTLGTYGYHFWMKMMTPIRKGSGNQYLHKRSELYRTHVRRKIDAYHRYVQLGCIAQGILQYLAASFGSKVWLHFNSWLRTMKCDRAPSEFVVAHTLRDTLPKFLVVKHGDHDLEKFIVENGDLSRLPELRLAG
jgi:hypothetical protein